MEAVDKKDRAECGDGEVAQQVGEKSLETSATLTPVFLHALYLNARRQRLYGVTEIGTHSEEQKRMVRYHAFYPESISPCYRPIESFQGTTVIDGVDTPRFKLLRADEVARAVVDIEAAKAQRRTVAMGMPSRVVDKLVIAIRDNPFLHAAWDAMPPASQEAVIERWKTIIDEESTF